MKEENNIIASTEGNEIHKIDSAEYIIRRTKEVMKNYPHFYMCRVMDEMKSCYERDKEVFNSINQDTKLYKRIVLFSESVFEEYRIVRKFIKDNRFFVEVSSVWLNSTKEIDIATLLTDKEVKEIEQIRKEAGMENDY